MYKVIVGVPSERLTFQEFVHVNNSLILLALWLLKWKHYLISCPVVHLRPDGYGWGGGQGGGLFGDIQSL